MSISFSDELADPKDYLPAAPHVPEITDVSVSSAIQEAVTAAAAESIQELVEKVIGYVKSRGFVFEPWQVAAFITAVRTKPFVILAGISGTGKTKLPRIVADATEAECTTVAVRPDWTDSSDLLGFERLDGTFRPGYLLRAAKRAQEEPGEESLFILDEMNIARVEYYLAEILSHMEELTPGKDGRIMSAPLVPAARDADGGAEWSEVCLTDNLCIVGSVNMDETTYGFSKKVLDRAFVVEFSKVYLDDIGETAEHAGQRARWPIDLWKPAALSLSSHPKRASAEVAQMIDTLTQVNDVLEQGQLQFGYRVRDEIVMFCLAAQECLGSFITSATGTVDPLDLAIAMKVLPRIQGGGETIRKVLEGLQAWASPDAVAEEGAPPNGEKAGFPFCADRVELMLRRWREAGFASYWL